MTLGKIKHKIRKSTTCSTVDASQATPQKYQARLIDLYLYEHTSRQTKIGHSVILLNFV
jgi:hypothetical protein